ncbi:MAG: ComF family protein [Chloroflexota bacterium]
MQQIRTAVYFIQPVQTFIHKFKYENIFALAQPLATWMVQAWPSWQNPIDLLIPVPLHQDRQRARGYNQSELLADQLSKHFGIPLATNALHRIRYTQPQVGLSAVDRHVNMAGAFVADADLINGKHILLIDDVFTTGATLSAATEILLTAGAQSVSGYCLARAKQR